MLKVNKNGDFVWEMAVHTVGTCILRGALLPCCALIFFFLRASDVLLSCFELILPCCALKKFFFARTYLAVPLSCFALTLLFAIFFRHLG